MSDLAPRGYNGKILRVNLTTGVIQSEAIDDQFCRKYIGGAGFIAYYLWKELKPGIDALSPDNKLIFAIGPVTGLTLPGASRNCIGTKSPLTGGIAKSEVGGYWMVELKRAGFDAIIVEGKAKRPVYLWVLDGKASIRDAGHLWGKETREAELAIRSELNDEHIQIAFIGLGGENQVRFACIMEGTHDAAGRGGMGAVMGSKNLKAIAVRGHGVPQVLNPDKIKEIRQALSHPYPISEFGTGGPDMLMQEATGDLPVHNFRDGAFPEVKMIHGGVIKDTIRTGMEGCFACPIRCKKVVKFEEPYKVDPAYGGPEYETLASLGSDCGVSDLKAIVKGNERCNAYGLDTLSTGGTIAFAMECYEKGLIDAGDVGGLELKWGNADALLKAIELIARREGFGNSLAEGTARLASKIGKGSQDFAMHVKGMEPGMHDPRMQANFAMSYMLAANGADHCGSMPDFFMANDFMLSQFHPLGYLTTVTPTDVGPYKVSLWRLGQFMNQICDSLVVCQFPSFSFESIAETLKAITGWDTGIPELLRIAERGITLMRLFNLREGITSTQDVLPKRFFQPTDVGALANLKIDPEAYNRAKQYYYALMGWDQKGVPLPEKVEDLQIC